MAIIIPSGLSLLPREEQFKTVWNLWCDMQIELLCHGIGRDLNVLVLMAILSHGQQGQLVELVESIKQQWIETGTFTKYQIGIRLHREGETK